MKISKKKIQEVEYKLLDYQIEKEALKRIKMKPQIGYSEEEVFGPNGLNDVSISDDDGWE